MTDQPAQLNWSGTFAVDTLLKGPTGDKIHLPSSVLEQLLNASASAARAASAHTNYHSSFPRYSSLGDFEQNAQQLPYPLTFRLVNESNGKAVYAGVREFSAEEGRVLLSPFLLRSLGLPSHTDFEKKEELDHPPETAPRIKITAHQLPKGHYVALSPKHVYELYDPSVLEPLLERELRQGYTTLTTGTTLRVRGGLKHEFEFLVESVKPEGDGICVIDTDLELDLLGIPTATDQGSLAGGEVRDRRKTSRGSPQAPDKRPQGGEIGLWKAAEGEVQHDEYVDYELLSWDKSRGLSVELTHLDDPDANGEFFLDVFVSPKSARLRKRPRETQHWMSRMGPYSSRHPTRLEIPAGAFANDDVECLMVAVYGFRDERLSAVGTRAHKFSLRVKPMGDDAPTNGGAAVEATPADAADKQKCGNCGQWIAKQSYVMHTLRCARNKKCPLCGLTAAADELREHWHCSICSDSQSESFGDSLITKAKHDGRFHPAEPFRCSCSDILEFSSVRALANHRVTDCPDKVILCRFCHLEVPQEGDATDPSSIAEAAYTGLTAHERADGARTANCDLCNVIVRLRDMASHLKHHDLNKKGRPTPVLCRNALCGRTLHGVGPRGQILGPGGGATGSDNDLGLCATCYGPLYVSMHDPEGKAMRRRIERRYLTQLLSGCGRAWCSNEWCRTGRANTGRDAVAATTAAALPLVRGFVTPEAIRDRSEKMHLCVDEAGQRALVVAEMLAAEGVWDLGWCVAACEAEADRDRAREWLQNWAPNKYE